MTSRLVALFACALLACTLPGCGGGGGGGGGGPGGGGPPPALQAIGQQILEQCGAPSLEAFLDLVLAVEAVLDAQETVDPGFMVTAVDQGAAQVTAFLDLDGDAAPDFIVIFLFADDQGMPAAPFDLNQLAAGLGPLDTLVAAMPDGGSITVSMTGIGPQPANVIIIVDFQGGAVSGVSANGTFQDADCGAALSFLDAALAALAGAVPTADLTVLFTSTDGEFDGAISLDGTSTATADGAVDSSTTLFQYTIDLNTGAVATVP